MNPLRNRIIIFSTLLLLSSCASASKAEDSIEGASSGSEASEKSDSQEGTVIIEGIELVIPDFPEREPANPANIEYSIESDNTQTQVIEGGIGGILTVQSQDGFTYSLEIPPAAIIGIAEVSITPLADISGLPIEGPAPHGVLLEPEGIVFVEPAILTITPPPNTNLDLIFGFGTFANGEDFHILPWVVASDFVQIGVSHFSSIGIVDGTDSSATLVDYYNLLKKNYSPSSSLAFYQNEIGVAAMGLTFEDDYKSILNNWMYSSILPIWQDAVNNPEKIDAAQWELFSWAGARLNQPGEESTFENEIQVVNNLTARAYKGAFEKAAELCQKGDAEQAFRMWRWERNIEILAPDVIYGRADLTRENVKDWVADCYQFKGTFRSFAESGENGITAQLSTSNIPFYWDASNSIETTVGIGYDFAALPETPAGFDCSSEPTPAKVLVRLKVAANFSYMHERAQEIDMEFYFETLPAEIFSCLPRVFNLWHAAFSRIHALVGGPQDAKIDMDIIRSDDVYASYVYTSTDPTYQTFLDDEIYLIHTPVGGPN
jgi:hypothetical protein